MGLRFPEDLDVWRRWQETTSIKSRIRHRIRPSARPGFVIMANGPKPRMLVLIEAPKPSTVAAYAAPLRFLQHEQVAILAPSDVSHLLEGEWATTELHGDEVPEQLRSVAVVFSAGHYLPAGELGYRWSRHLGARFVVAQHGLMTPFAPPLAEQAHLLSFSESDAAFWESGRTDVTHEVVGAQILWDAARPERRQARSADAKPVFLGQLHGAELPRRTTGGTALRFCLASDADYRPHPSETDRLSRLQHAAWKRRGVRFESSCQSLATLNRPVVSVFSTGVLEAAAAGQDAWVTCIDPPEWVRDFWKRYGLSQWGEAPTPPPVVPPVEPAQSIAASLARILEGTE